MDIEPRRVANDRHQQTGLDFWIDVPFKEVSVGRSGSDRKDLDGKHSLTYHRHKTGSPSCVNVPVQAMTSSTK